MDIYEGKFIGFGTLKENYTTDPNIIKKETKHINKDGIEIIEVNQLCAPSVENIDLKINLKNKNRE